MDFQFSQESHYEMRQSFYIYTEFDLKILIMYSFSYIKIQKTGNLNIFFKSTKPLKK